eukprot:5282875-Pyramimonas_sp.AAC.1
MKHLAVASGIASALERAAVHGEVRLEVGHVKAGVEMKQTSIVASVSSAEQRRVADAVAISSMVENICAQHTR